MRTIFALFEGYSEAREAVEELIDRHFDEGEMNVVVQELTGRGGMDINSRTMNVDKTASPGTGVMRGLDRLLAGRKPVIMPDAGAVYAAGGMASMAAGAATRERPSEGLKNMLLALDVPQELAEFYTNGVLEGGVLLWIRTDEARVAEAANILSRTKGEEIANYA
ncbi:MAG: hypothetical protein ABSC19_11240 [Syntrophorhabdales bacterium]|jgi:hypothetical protein